LPYAKAERIDVKEGIIISQYYSHFLFFLEVIEVDIPTDLQADYMMEDTSLFLFMMLDGNILFHKHDGEHIAEAKGISETPVAFRCWTYAGRVWRRKDPFIQNILSFWQHAARHVQKIPFHGLLHPLPDNDRGGSGNNLRKKKAQAYISSTKNGCRHCPFSERSVRPDRTGAHYAGMLYGI